MTVRAVCVLLAFLPAAFVSVSPAADVPGTKHDLTHRFWPAAWIADAKAPPTDYGVFHFRKTFDLPAKPATFVIHVSADNRYRLFVNGVPVSRGPARGDPMHWRYETVDVAPQLRAGRNVFAAVVWNGAASKPWAQMTVRTAFLVQGDSRAEDVVNTDPTWRVAQDRAYAPEPIDRAALHTFIVSGDGERIDGALHPWGWEQPQFDDLAWPPAAKVRDAVPYGVGTDLDWWLVRDALPPMEESPQRLVRVRRATGVTVPDGFLAGHAPLRVPPHTRATLLLDQSFETNAYPTMTVSGGAGAEVRLVYAEALVDAAGKKGNRNEVEGRRCLGKTDVFRPDGGPHRAFTTLWYRTYRYIEVEITTADAALDLDDLTAAFTGYPFVPRGQFSSDDAGLQRIWDVGWRTARLCAHETFYDCPYYEQLQYVGDTRIQALISLNVAGDDRLARNAIELFDVSRIPEGLTQSRYPSASPQVINTFSLFWVDMIHDYWRYRDDPAFVQDKLRGIRGVLEWFEERIDARTGMLGPLPYWTFVDWPQQWPWVEANHIGGEPPGAHEGGSAIVSLQLAVTLQNAAELFVAFGQPAAAAHYRETAAALRQATLQRCWDNRRKLVADTPAKTSFSQHANVMAVLADAIDRSAAPELIARVASDPALVPCTYYFRFYLLRAMKHAGLGDSYLDALGPWHDMLARGLTTFAERQEPTRSDCHAWSASPCFEFLATVAGVEPGSPGFRTVRIEPHLGHLTQAIATVPTGTGDVTVKYVRNGAHLDADVTLPPGKSGEMIWRGVSTPLHPGAQHLSLE